MARYTTNRRVIRTSYGFGWVRERVFDTASGRWVRQGDEGSYILEKRVRNLKDECHDTGWYLYGDGFFGEFCGTRILEACEEANQVIKTQGV